MSYASNIAFSNSATKGATSRKKSQAISRHALRQRQTPHATVQVRDASQFPAIVYTTDLVLRGQRGFPAGVLRARTLSFGWPGCFAVRSAPPLCLGCAAPKRMTVGTLVTKRASVRDESYRKTLGMYTRRDLSWIARRPFRRSNFGL